MPSQFVMSLVNIDLQVDKLYDEYNLYCQSLKHLPFVEKSDLIHAQRKIFNQVIYARWAFVRCLMYFDAKGVSEYEGNRVVKFSK